MKKYLSISLLYIISFQFISAQNANDILSDGILVKSNQKIFLQFDSGTLKVDIAKSLQDQTNPPDFITLKDSSIFLIKKDGVNIYLRPINPLSFSYSTENKVVIDPVNSAAANAMGNIASVFSNVGAPSTGAPNTGAPLKKKCPKVIKLEKSIQAIQTKLTDDKKIEIIEAFNKLKALDFSDETSTINALALILMATNSIQTHFKGIETEIETAKKTVGNYNCSTTDPFVMDYIFNSKLKMLTTVLTEQKKRFNNLMTVYNLVEQAQIKGSKGGGENGLRWCFKLDEVPSKQGEVSIYEITIKESGYKLSEEKEIISTESSIVLQKKIRIRKFQRFVPEVTAGTAFTFFNYKLYETTSDSLGQQYIGTPNKNIANNINVSTMLNFNYYIPNSSINPFYQIGAGINTGLPTILTGLGIRSNIKNRTFTVSAGIGMTWVKDLAELNVGDLVSGTDDIAKDFKFRAAPEFAPYIGLQHKF